MRPGTTGKVVGHFKQNEGRGKRGPHERANGGAHADNHQHDPDHPARAGSQWLTTPPQRGPDRGAGEKSGGRENAPKATSNT